MLILGLLTRISGLVLAITIGVAAFGFHQVTPLFVMHITQNYFWTFLLFIFLGAGKFSIDYLILKSPFASLSKLFRTGVPVFFTLLFIGVYLEFFTQKKVVADDVVFSSINIPGNFNDWDPAANEMKKLDKNNYALEIEFKEIGPIEFKFTTNKTWDANLGNND